MRIRTALSPFGITKRCPNVMRVAGAAAERPTTARALARHVLDDEGLEP
jgi:hypothetical protein